jgi:hypothetical protein
VDTVSSVEEVQVSSLALVEVEHAFIDANVVELPAPEGWSENLFLKNEGVTLQRYEIHSHRWSQYGS